MPALQAIINSILHGLILLAVFALVWVPPGMMPHRGEDGALMIVLCTPEGPQEAWLNADGEIEPADPKGHDSPHSDKPCLRITLATSSIDLAVKVPVRIAAYHIAQERLRDNPFIKARVVTAHLARAPPVLS